MRRVAGAGALRVAHDIWKGAKRDELEVDDEFTAFAHSLKAAAEKNADLRATLGVSAAQNSDIKPKASKAPASILSPADVREVFCGITDDDCELLWLDPVIGRPENLVLNALLVPPTPIRPSVAVEAPGGAGTNEDDLTIKLQEIIDVNESLKKALREGAGDEDPGGVLVFFTDASSFIYKWGGAGDATSTAAPEADARLMSALQR